MADVCEFYRNADSTKKEYTQICKQRQNHIVAVTKSNNCRADG